MKTLTRFSIGILVAGSLASADNFVNLDSHDISRYQPIDRELKKMKETIQDPDAGFFVNAKTGKIVGQQKTHKPRWLEPAKKPQVQAKKVKKTQKAKPVMAQSEHNARADHSHTPGKSHVDNTPKYKGKHLLAPIQIEEETIVLD